MNPLRDKRLYEVRRRLHTRNLDIGAGSYPVTRESVTFDSQNSKHPDFEGDLLHGLPFPDGSFDGITILEVLEHFFVLDQLSILFEAKRVMSPGGQIIVTIPYSKGPWKLMQRIAWFVRIRTTQKEYLHNGHTHGHIGLCSPEILERMLKYVGFQLKERKRLMFYDYLISAIKPN